MGTALVGIGTYLVLTAQEEAEALRDRGTSLFTAWWLGFRPQVATVTWNDPKTAAFPPEQRVLLLGEHEEAVLLYDCRRQRTTRVSGGAVTVQVVDSSQGSSRGPESRPNLSLACLLVPGIPGAPAAHVFGSAVRG